MPTISLTVDAATAQRVAAAFGRALLLTGADGQPRDATLAEVKNWLALQVTSVVRAQERAAAQRAAEGGVTDAVVT